MKKELQKQAKNDTKSAEKSHVCSRITGYIGKHAAKQCRKICKNNDSDDNKKEQTKIFSCNRQHHVSAPSRLTKNPQALGIVKRGLRHN